jgi:hypothetical protein
MLVEPRLLCGQEIAAWYVVAAEDQTLRPEMERFLAQRMGAIRIEINSILVISCCCNQ